MPGDVINGYRLVTEFTTVGGGQCQWAFAEKGRVVYFLKRFLDPRYPVSGSPGSWQTKLRRLERCRAFEQHQRALIAALQGRCAAGGNLVIARDFFRDGTAYYKVTDRIETAALTPHEIARLPLAQQLLLLKTVAHSVAIVHTAGIVHSDLRPENVLVKQTAAGVFVTKLIDLDSCYFTSVPPPPDQLTADPAFRAPESAQYTSGSAIDPRTLTTKADAFSLGLLFATFTLGAAAFADFAACVHRYAHEFVLARTPIPLAWDRMPPVLAPIVRQMLAPSPADRPTMREVLAALTRGSSEPTTAPVPRFRGAPISPPSSPTHSTLRGTLLR